MKKFLALFLTLALALSLVACVNPGNGDGSSTPESSTPAPSFDPSVKSEGVMTYAEFMSAEVNSEVTVEAFVQGHQSWWDNKITVYAQDLDGGYYFYELTCTEENATKLVPGTRIKVTGTKAEWGGEIEIMNGTFEILEGTWVAQATDITALLGTDDLAAKMNTFAAFKGLMVKSVSYKNGTPGDDVYLTLVYGENDYDFCVEIYLTGEDSDVYKTVATLKAGDVVDVEGFVYWYNGPNPHITSIKVVTPAADPALKSEGVMTYAEFMAAEINSEVTVEAFVHGHQSWWDNKITVYAQDKDGGYYFYELACSEEDAAKLLPGTRIKVTGTKAEWGGEIEIMNGTFEILEGRWIAEPVDLTDLLGTEELINKMNTLAAFKGLTVKAIEYKNGTPGDDIYLTLSLGEDDYDFCVEIYLTGENSSVYKTVGELEVGNVVDVEGFLYWYNGANPHITNITVVG